MADIIHRYINGNEVKYDDLPHYKITNQTILDIVHSAIKRTNGDSTVGKSQVEHTA